MVRRTAKPAHAHHSPPSLPVASGQRHLSASQRIPRHTAPGRTAAVITSRTRPLPHLTQSSCQVEQPLSSHGGLRACSWCRASASVLVVMRGCVGPPRSLAHCRVQRRRHCQPQPQQRRSPQRSTPTSARSTHHQRLTLCAPPRSAAALPSMPLTSPPSLCPSQLIDLDRRRHQTMEALAQFRVRPGKTSAVSVDGKSWACLGPFFLQLPSEQVQDMLNKGHSAGRRSSPLSATNSLPPLCIRLPSR